jgi:branched-chain amino acid transport system permease protein
MGSIKGAVIAALVLSVLSSIVTTEISPIWAPLTFFGALFITLIVRPQGLFGKTRRI